MKNEIKNIIEFWIYINHKNENEIQIKENSPLVSTTSTPSQWFIAGKYTVKKWVHIKTWRGIFRSGVWGGENFYGGIIRTPLTYYDAKREIN